MAGLNGKSLLLRNLDALMKHHWGKVNKTRLAAEAKVGQGTYDRISEGTSVGIDVLEKVAAIFKLKPWQLLACEIDPLAPPEIVSSLWPFPDIERERWEALGLRKQIEIQGVVRERIESFEHPNGNKKVA